MREERGDSTARKTLARFRIRDAYHPPPQELLGALFGDQELQGRVVAFSDNGEPGGAFVVLQVNGLSHTVIVPVTAVTQWCDG